MSGVVNVDPDYTEQLELLIQDGKLEEGTPEYGIALQMIDKGEDSLSDDQWKVFHSYIFPMIEEYENDAAMERAIAKDPF